MSTSYNPEWCTHDNNLFWDDVRKVLVQRGYCVYCNSWYSLGPSDEENADAACGILAEQIALGDVEMTELHSRGYDDYTGTCSWHPLYWSPTFHAGWLAAAIHMHDTGPPTDWNDVVKVTYLPGGTTRLEGKHAVP